MSSTRVLLMAVLLAVPLVTVGVALGFALSPENTEGHIARVRPLVTAINQYRTEHGTYPERLDQVMPRYVAGNPASGECLLIAYRGHISAGVRNRHRHFIYYDWGWIDRDRGWYLDEDDGRGPVLIRKE